MNALIFSDKGWLLSEEAFSIYSQCMYHATYNIHYRTAEMGYYIGEPYWGNGYMTNAIKQVCEYVFKNTDIIRFFAEPFTYNIASCRALEKAGFQYEGRGLLCFNHLSENRYALRSMKR